MNQEHFEKVKEFNILFGFEQSNSYETVRLRNSLFWEEQNEFEQALRDDNIIEVADGLADMMYIVLGSIYIFEHDAKLLQLELDKLKTVEKLIDRYFTNEQFDLIFNEVHKSNMSKACNSLDTAFKTMATDLYKDLSAFAIRIENGKYALYCNADNELLQIKKGKLLKSIDYQPADLNFVKEWNITI